MSVRDLSLIISWFETAFPKGPAYGDPEHTTWGAFTEVFRYRREGTKDGPNFVPSRFVPEADGRHVRRKKVNVIVRTAVALDIETDKTTGEVPPSPQEAMARAKCLGLACITYTSHSHQRGTDPRYRMVFPLSSEIPPEIPAPEIMAKLLGLDGVLDRSKIGAASLFYLPSCADETIGEHYTELADGGPIDAAWIIREGSAILEVIAAAAQRAAAEAHTAAAARRAEKIAAGFDDDDSLIEKIRTYLDLESILLSHGYDKSGQNYRHPNSSSGMHGANIKLLGGVERIYSHNASDPLHASNLPEWCGGVTAIDAFDVTAILDFGGARNKALHGLAERFSLTKTAERKTLAALIFRLIRAQAPQQAIEQAAFAEGDRLGLSRDDVCRVAQWVAGQSTEARKAA